MTYSFNPLTDEELDSFELLPEGIYDFEVLKSDEKVSKSGNQMSQLLLGVYDNKSGKMHNIFDYLVFSEVKLNIKKVKHFCEATGLIEQYKTGKLTSDLERKCGKVEIGTQDEQPKQSGGFYPKKNIVIDYVKSNSTINKKEVIEEFKDDELPF